MPELQSALHFTLACVGALGLCVTGCGESSSDDEPSASGASAGQGGSGAGGSAGSSGEAGSAEPSGGDGSGGTSNPSSCTGPANEIPGDGDPSFGSFGIANLPLQSADDASATLGAVELLAGGKIAGVGYDPTGCIVFRLNSDGSPDESFGTSGVTRFGSSGEFCAALTLDSAERLLISSNRVGLVSVWDAALWRIASDGAVDTAFGTDGVAMVDLGSNNDRTIASVARSDGSSVSLAMRDANGPTPGTLLVFLDADGQPTGESVELDTGAGRNIPVALAERGDELLVAGFNQTDSLAFFAKVDAAGALVSSFGEGGWARTEPGSVSLLLGLQPNADGTLLAWANGSGQRLVSFDELGNPGPFAGETSGYARKVAVQCDGKVLAAGLSADDISRGMLERLLPDGSVDTEFGELGSVFWQSLSGPSEVTSLLVQQDAKIVVGGWGIGASPYVARVLP